MPYDVVVVGSANLDLVSTAHRLPGPGETVLGSHFAEHPGGKGLNQAVAAARSGGSVAMVGAVGDDAAGQLLASVAGGEGVDVSRVARVADVATGRAIITVDERAENSIVVIAGANARVSLHSLPEPITSATVVLAQLEVPVDAVIGAFGAARAAGCRTVLNPAPAPVDGLADELLAVCDVIVPNEHEVELLGGVDRLLAHGVAAVVVTLGARGVDVSESPGTAPWHLDAFEVAAVDTTGAGDAFCGALATRLSLGDDLHLAVRYAAAAGALATTVAGAVPSIPRSPAIDRLVNT